MLDRLRQLLGGSGGGKEPEDERASDLAAEYYATAQEAASRGDPAQATRWLGFAAELDDSYRVRALDDPAFDSVRGDERYRLVTVRRLPEQEAAEQ